MTALCGRRQERKKSLEGSGDARSTIEGMLTARRMARAEQEQQILANGVPGASVTKPPYCLFRPRDPAHPDLRDSQTSGPPEWFIAFKTGMEARVSDLENQLEEKADEVQELRERLEALEAAPKVTAAASADKDGPTAAKPSAVPKLSMGTGSGGEQAKSTEKPSAVPTISMPSKIASPKTRPQSAKTSPKGTKKTGETKKEVPRMRF